ncbi:transcriptional regulator [Enterobacteriaceae bacterium RIT714]|nr:transcriptional regulator [Enterobacteriaceae bacterium RIT714]
MMGAYLIAGHYVFNEDTKELKDLNSDVVIKMTSMKARCLSYIVQHANDEVIEKSALSDALWGARSKFSSEASLTQVLYLIRRDFKSLGVNDFFVTIPKAGIKVNAMVKIEPIKPKKRRSQLSWTPIMISISLSLVFIVTALFFWLTK